MSEIVPAITVANFFIKSGHGEYSPLKIQKLIYISNLVHIRRFKEKLVKEAFQAWEYGPVIPSLYHELKQYGRLHIRKPIECDDEIKLNDNQLALLKKVDEVFGNMTPSRLVSITHTQGGAWDKNYVPGAALNIADKDILEEANSYGK